MSVTGTRGQAELNAVAGLCVPSNFHSPPKHQSLETNGLCQGAKVFASDSLYAALAGFALRAAASERGPTHPEFGTPWVRLYPHRRGSVKWLYSRYPYTKFAYPTELPPQRLDALEPPETCLNGRPSNQELRGGSGMLLDCLKQANGGEGGTNVPNLKNLCKSTT